MRKRDLLILLAALTAAAVTAVGIFSGSALPTGSWGLSFRQEGAPPIGNAGIDQLKRYDAAYIGSTSEKVLYLTFDAGYETAARRKYWTRCKSTTSRRPFSWWATTSRKTPIWCAE